MIKKIAIALVLAVLVTVGVGLALPRSWSVERSIVIARGPAQIYPYLFDLRRWQDANHLTHLVAYAPKTRLQQLLPALKQAYPTARVKEYAAPFYRFDRSRCADKAAAEVKCIAGTTSSAILHL